MHLQLLPAALGVQVQGAVNLVVEAAVLLRTVHLTADVLLVQLPTPVEVGLCRQEPCVVQVQLLVLQKPPIAVLALRVAHFQTSAALRVRLPTSTRLKFILVRDLHTTLALVEEV